MAVGVQTVKRTFLLVFVSAAAAAIVFASGSPGIRPRAVAADYPSHNGMSLATVGAAVIPASEAKRILGVDLNSAGYVVIEVGVFPEPGKDVDLSPSDFTLVTDPDAIGARPVDDEAIAATIDRKQNPSRTPSRPTDIYTSAGATIGHGTWTDPNTGRRVGTTVTGVETGVGVGGPPRAACPGGYCDDRQTAPFPPASTGPNRGQIEQELWQQSLPDGTVHNPVAGYLYFPKPSGKAKKAPWVLRLDNNGARVKLDLPNPGK
jgi:hypothetical protein